MRKYIDAHVHITPETALGKSNQRFGTKNLPYDKVQMADCVLQTMPCYIRDSQFTAETLIHLMNVYGVEKAVILQSLMACYNEEIAKAVQQYPDRLAGAMVIEPVDGWQEKMHRLYAAGLHVIKFEMRAHTNPAAYPNARYDDAQMTAIFDQAEALNMTAAIDPAPVDFPVYQPKAFATAVHTHPGLNFVLCHLAYPRPIETSEHRARWCEMVRAACQPNCWIDVSALPDFFDAEGWPYPTALKLLKEVKQQCGSEKLIWGTDITGTLNRATYPQMIEMFTRSGLFSEAELNQLFYENAKAAYRL